MLSIEEKVLSCYGKMNNHSIAKVLNIPHKRVLAILYGGRDRVSTYTGAAQQRKNRKSHSMLSLWNDDKYESSVSEIELWRNLGTL